MKYEVMRMEYDYDIYLFFRHLNIVVKKEERVGKKPRYAR